MTLFVDSHLVLWLAAQVGDVKLDNIGCLAPPLSTFLEVSTVVLGGGRTCLLQHLACPTIMIEPGLLVPSLFLEFHTAMIFVDPPDEFLIVQSHCWRDFDNSGNLSQLLAIVLTS